MNVTKRFQTSFHRHKNVFDFKCMRRVMKALNQVDQVRDLGITFTDDLSFNAPMNSTYSKSPKVLGFLSRTCAEFQNIKCFTVLYCASVSFILDFWSVVLEPVSDGANRKKLRKYKGVLFIMCLVI